MPSLRDLLAVQAAGTPPAAAPAKAPAKKIDFNPAPPSSDFKLEHPKAAKPRPLCKTTPGEEIPMWHPVPGIKSDAEWNHALFAMDTELCICFDPNDPEQAWISIKRKEGPGPLMLFPLPLYSRQVGDQPF
jgi:hypothetical protein